MRWVNTITSALIFSLIFFFQAEDGIRDATVTGVQTCALPICLLFKAMSRLTSSSFTWQFINSLYSPCRDFVFDRIFPCRKPHFNCRVTCPAERSEERRVGKECSCVWAMCDECEIGG